MSRTTAPLADQNPTEQNTSPQPRRPRRSRLLIAAILIGLLAPLVSVAGSAEARRSPKEQSIAWAVKRLINAERVAHGLPKVTMNWNLRQSARAHDVHMARANSMSHQLRGEADFGRRMDRHHYHWTWAGENIGWNATMTRSGVLLLERLMYNEKAPNDGHRQNILNPHFTNVGVDVYIDKHHHKVWLTTDFGSK